MNTFSSEESLSHSGEVFVVDDTIDISVGFGEREELSIMLL